MDFLRSEIAFKAATRAIERLLLNRSNVGDVTPAELAEVLMPFSKTKNGDDLLNGARHLAGSLNGRDRVQTYSQLQQRLAQAFAQRTYQSLRESFDFPIDFRQLFPDAALPNACLEPDREQVHPYPDELHELRELAAWHRAWVERAVSTREQPFFPPMLPASCFAGSRPTYERRRDWRPSYRNQPEQLSHHFQNGRCCVLVRHDGRHLIGAAGWRWWGEFGCIRGVEFSLYLLANFGWLKVVFDIRPYDPLPTYGPRIYRDGIGGDADHIQAGLRELAELDVHQWPTEEELMSLPFLLPPPNG